MDVVLGIDLGTSYFKAALVNRDGELPGIGRAAVPSGGNPERPWDVELDSFRRSIKIIIDESCKNAGIKASDICAVSYASQANSFVLLDEAFQPLTPLILWPDIRDSVIDDRVTELWNRDDFLETTGMNLQGPDFAMVKIRWFQKNRPNLWNRVRHVMTISDYLSYWLTGECIGDAGTASLLGLYNLKNMNWWTEALSILNIPEELLSRVYRPGTVSGRVSSSAAEHLGLRKGIPFSSGGLDHHIAAFGAGAETASGISESTGTVLACYQSPVGYYPDSSSCLGPSLDEGTYYRLKFNNNGGRGVEWYRKNFADEYSLPELDALAAAVPPGSEGLAALPEVFRGTDLSGFLNSSNLHEHGHYFRAIMESTAAGLLTLLPETCLDSDDCRIFATGGGAGSGIWLQIKAHLTGKIFLTSSSIEPAAYGAAMLASVAAGWFDTCRAAAESWVKIKDVFHPDPALHRQYADWLRTYRELIKNNEQGRES